MARRPAIPAGMRRRVEELDRQRWADHFAWEDDGVTVRGLTPPGRATLALQRLNNPWLVQARRIWILVGLQPPLE